MSMPSACSSSTRSRPSFFSSADSPSPAWAGTSSRICHLSTPSDRATTYAASPTMRSYGWMVRATAAPCHSCPGPIVRVGAARPVVPATRANHTDVVVRPRPHTERTTPPRETTMQTNLRFDHQLLAVEGEHDVHCMLELHAPNAPDADRPPLHLALVVDRSGSMAGAKLTAAQASARFLAGRMRATDRLALVTYDDD